MKAERNLDDYARRVIWLGAGIILLVFLLGMCAGRATAHEPYTNWKMRNGISCCDNTDCRPTRAYMDEYGRWRTWDGVEWVIVPNDAVLSPDLAHDGRSHYCGKRGPLGALPYCFSPAEPKI